MSVRNLKDGSKTPWVADVYPEGRNGPRKRKTFATKGEALAWESFILSASSLEWQAKATASDERKLSDLITLWFGRHGQTLADGERRLNGEVYVPGSRKSRLRRLQENGQAISILSEEIWISVLKG